MAKLIIPIPITPEMLTYSNIPIDAGADEWSADHGYPETLIVGHVGSESNPDKVVTVYRHNAGGLTQIQNALDARPYIDQLPSGPPYPFTSHISYSDNRAYMALTVREGDGPAAQVTLYKRKKDKWARQEFLKSYVHAEFLGDLLLCGLNNTPFVHGFAWKENFRQLEPPENLPGRPLTYSVSPGRELILAMIGEDMPLWRFYREGEQLIAKQLISGQLASALAGHEALPGQTLQILPTVGRELFGLTTFEGEWYLRSFSIDEFLNVVPTQQAQLEYEVKALRYSPNGTYMALGYEPAGEDPYLSVWKRVHITHPAGFFHYAPLDLGEAAPEEVVTGFAWSPDSRFLFIRFADDPYFLILERIGDVFELVEGHGMGVSGLITALACMSATGYSAEDVVRRGNDLYESVIFDNRGNDPATQDLTRPTWLKIGRVNRWRMFDEYANTHTTGDPAINNGNIVKTIEKAGIENVFLAGLEAQSVRIERTSEPIFIVDHNGRHPVNYDNAKLAANVEGAPWFQEIDATDREKMWVELDQPLTDLSKLLIVIRNGGDPAQCAIMAVSGEAITLGKSMYGIESGAMDHSRIDPDDWGRVSLREGIYAATLRPEVLVESADYDWVGRVLKRLRATNCVWDFNGTNTSYERLIVYGFISGPHRDVKRRPGVSTLRLEIREFT